MAGKLIIEFSDYWPASFSSPFECILYSNFAGLYPFFSDSRKRQLDRLLIEHMVVNDISMEGLHSIREPANLPAKSLILRLSEQAVLKSEPIPLLGELTLIGCDMEVLEKSSIFKPHLQAYLIKCGQEGLILAKAHIQTTQDTFESFILPLESFKQTSDFRFSSSMIKIALLRKLDSALFAGVVLPNKRDARSLYPNGKSNQRQKYGAFSGLAQRNREAAQRDWTVREFKFWKGDDDEDYSPSFTE